MTGDISLVELLNLCIRCARAASEIIHSIHSLNQDRRLSMGVVEKTVHTDTPEYRDQHDPPNYQTAADRITEHHILNELRYAFSNVTVIGEEESESIGDLKNDHNITYQWILRDIEFPPLESYSGGSSYMMLNSEGVIIWVDPLDGTFGFTRGHLGCVTTMIGISYNGVPVAGVISRPLCGSTFVGLMHCGLFYLARDSCKMILLRRQPSNTNDLQLSSSPDSNALDSPRRVEPDANQIFRGSTQGRLRLVTSRNRCSKFVVDCINEVSLKSDFSIDIVRCAGAGMKFLLLLLGYVDFYVYPRAGLRMWDVCAGAALLKSVGGLLTDEKGNVITFDLYEGTYSNSTNTIISGIVASNSSFESIETVSLPGLSNCVSISTTGALFPNGIEGQESNETLINQFREERERRKSVICDHSIIVNAARSCSEMNK